MVGVVKAHGLGGGGGFKGLFGEQTGRGSELVIIGRDARRRRKAGEVARTACGWEGMLAAKVQDGGGGGGGGGIEERS